MTLTNNAQTRRSLASQLDRHEAALGRLEGVIDVLADGLSLAVTTCVEQSVTAAVRSAVVEVLTSPALQQRLRQGLKPDKPERPANPVVRAAKRLGGWVTGGVALACGTVGSFVRTACSKVAKAVVACKNAACTFVASACAKTKAAAKVAWAGTYCALSSIASGTRKLFRSLVRRESLAGT
jgi:hypothetical protein